MSDQWAASIRRDSPNEKRQTLEFNLEAASVNSNIFLWFPELVTVTFIGIRSSQFFIRGYSWPHHLNLSSIYLCPITPILKYYVYLPLKRIHTSTRSCAISLGILSMSKSTQRRISGFVLCRVEWLRFVLSAWAFWAIVLYRATSLAMQVINAAGLAVAMSVRACLAVRQESAFAVRGSP